MIQQKSNYSSILQFFLFFQMLYMFSIPNYIRVSLPGKCFSVLFAGRTAQAQWRYPLKRRTTPVSLGGKIYREGIDCSSPASPSGSLKFHSAKSLCDYDSSTVLPEKVVKICFVLDEDSRLSIKLFQNKDDLCYRNYPPVTEQWETGRNIFRWPSEIIDHYEINIQDLLICAEKIGSYSTVKRIIPISIYREYRPQKIQGYEFIFSPATSIPRLTFEITGENPDQVLFEGERSNIGRFQNVVIQWNFENQTLHKGLYFLSIQINDSKESYEFYHEDLTLLKKDL